MRSATRLVAEMGVIIFSVLLALLVNEWRQAQSRSATVRAVLETVRAEAIANRSQVADALDHHRTLVAQLRSGGIEMVRFDIREAGLDTTSAARLAHTLRAAALAQGAPFRGDFEAERRPDGGWLVMVDERHFNVRFEDGYAVVRGTGNISLRPPFLIDSAWETAQATQAAVHMDPAVIGSLARIRQLQNRLDLTVDRLIDMLYGTAAGGEILPALNDLVWFETDLLQAYDNLLAEL